MLAWFANHIQELLRAFKVTQRKISSPLKLPCQQSRFILEVDCLLGFRLNLLHTTNSFAFPGQSHLPFTSLFTESSRVTRFPSQLEGILQTSLSSLRKFVDDSLYATCLPQLITATISQCLPLRIQAPLRRRASNAVDQHSSAAKVAKMHLKLTTKNQVSLAAPTTAAKPVR